MGYRFSCDPVIVGRAAHDFLGHLLWAMPLPKAEPNKGGRWAYDCSGWKRPHAAITVMMSVGHLHECLHTPHIQIEGEHEDDIQHFDLEQLSPEGPPTWEWLGVEITNLRGDPDWHPGLKAAKHAWESRYQGYSEAPGSEICEALRPLLLESVLVAAPQQGWGPGRGAAAHAAAERYAMWGATLEQNADRLRRASAALAERGVRIPERIEDLVEGFAKHPSSW